MNEPISRPDLGSDQPECPYEPDEIIPKSGIYAICHSDGSQGSCVFVAGEKFPACSCCERQVRYRLVRAVPYLFEDDDFRR